MKKEPMARYEKKTGRSSMLGMMADDSKAREKVYLQTGCNAFDAKLPRSMPMGFWCEQDVIEALKRYKIPYAEVYGDIEHDERGRSSFTGVHSTGCIFCCFGLHMEKKPNRFQQLGKSHPHLFDFCMHKLGLKEVLDYMRNHCPDRNVAKKFCYEPFKYQKQLSLF
jgi:3'-phosphoadenosine 5'-phosphosulfate sulfotransferase (PAPS reductase)/FAD synthetase